MGLKWYTTALFSLMQSHIHFFTLWKLFYIANWKSCPYYEIIWRRLLNRSTSRNSNCSHNFSRFLHAPLLLLQEVTLQKINCKMLKTEQFNFCDTSEPCWHFYELYLFSQKLHLEQVIKTSFLKIWQHLNYLNTWG